MKKLILFSLLALSPLVASSKNPHCFPKFIDEEYFRLAAYDPTYWLNFRLSADLPDNVKTVKTPSVFFSFDKDGKLLMAVWDNFYELDTIQYSYKYSKGKTIQILDSKDRKFRMEWNADSMITKIVEGDFRLETFSYVNKNLLKLHKCFRDGVLCESDSLIYNADGTIVDYQLTDKVEADTLTFNKYGTIIKRACSNPERNIDASDVEYAFYPCGCLKSVISKKGMRYDIYDDQHVSKNHWDENAVYTYYK